MRRSNFFGASWLQVQCTGEQESPLRRPGQMHLTYKVLGVAGGTTRDRAAVLLPPLCYD